MSNRVRQISIPNCNNARFTHAHGPSLNEGSSSLQLNHTRTAFGSLPPCVLASSSAGSVDAGLHGDTQPIPAVFAVDPSQLPSVSSIETSRLWTPVFNKSIGKDANYRWRLDLTWEPDVFAAALGHYANGPTLRIECRHFCPDREDQTTLWGKAKTGWCPLPTPAVAIEPMPEIVRLRGVQQAAVKGEGNAGSRPDGLIVQGGIAIECGTTQRRHPGDETLPSISHNTPAITNGLFSDESMDQLARSVRQLVTEWEKWQETENYRLVQFGFMNGRISVRHTEKPRVSRNSCYIRCARYNGKTVVPMSDVLTFLPYMCGREFSDEERGVVATALTRRSFREVTKSAYKKIFGAHVEQTMLFLLDDLHNLVHEVIAEVSRI
ncbi:hypothetical protein QBC46DRAFT_413107 [Diplogelasinospora grovesii]|uniref:Uncharacterized protein n=1 Tax=Diplogelasinospora grovesii TaxID=303347 RepID=A0AAN6MXK9_9PEZI|nr:hypothetical protein QBC46DRAFT_413107 [Diplogelasinospora grovesii]